VKILTDAERINYTDSLNTGSFVSYNAGEWFLLLHGRPFYLVIKMIPDST